MDENKIICHIVSADNNDKIELDKFCKTSNKFELIDLDIMNDQILNHDDMQKLFKQYNRFKISNNDKHKEVLKKMTKHWEDTLVKKVGNHLTNKKKLILVGKNHHFRFISKKIDFNASNKFILDKDIKGITKNIIKNNIDKNLNSIINGSYPLENLDFKKQQTKFLNFEKSYTKLGYSKIKHTDLIDVLNNHSTNKIKGKGLWISLDEEYNVGSSIHPNKSKIYGYTDPVLSLIESFDLSHDDSKNSKKVYELSNDKVNIIDINDSNINKLKKSRYMYYVSKENFIPSSKDSTFKYNTQNSVHILEKDQIKNVYKKFKELKIIT
jgi:hypothetical protein